MMKLTCAERKAHDLAVELIHSFPAGRHRNELMDCPCGNGSCEHCDNDGKITVLQYIFDNYLPGAVGSVDKCANFFTPFDDALQVVWCCGAAGRILEPSAGIGVIADAVRRHNGCGTPRSTDHLVCVELVEAFVNVGRILVPEAEWICGNLFDVLPKLGAFDCAIGNPPFGNIPSNRSTNFAGNIAFGILDALAPVVKHGGAFILPAGSHGYAHAQADSFAEGNRRPYRKWKQIHPEWELVPSAFQVSNQWHAATIQCEICEWQRDERYQPEPLPTDNPAAIPQLRSLTIQRPDDVWANL